tara:strand:+ start:70 stop:666 length:597 start_codon:yes stop_codon:yes gene_type:complete
MIKIQGLIPRKVIVATSGGVDSMAVVDFLKRNHTVAMQFVHHGTDTSEEAYQFLCEYEQDNGVPLYVNYIDSEVPDRTSQEEHWRNERYKVFQQHGISVITCHHLDDCAETWIWSSLNGTGKTIPYRNENVIRPFRLNRKSEFVDWCKRKNVKWVEDKSNKDNKYMRNYIRNELMSHALVVNPGLHTVLKRKVEQETI